MESKDAFIIANDIVTVDIVKAYEKALTMQRLEGIRLLYASCHSWSNGEYSISNAMLEKDKKEDDVYISMKWQEEYDEEPKLITPDYHIPKTNKVKNPDTESCLSR